MSRRPLGCALIVAGLVVVGVGIWCKRALGLVSLMVVLHIGATTLLLIPGVMALVWRPNPGELDVGGDGAGEA